MPEDVPYLGAGVPRAIAQVLVHNGETADFAEVAAAGGWAFSFGYQYGHPHVAALAVNQFTFLPERLGYDRESVGCGDRAAFWNLVKRNVDAGTPLVCTHFDGGLVYGYREKDGDRQFWFDGDPTMGWTNVEQPHPLDTCDVFVKRREPQPREDILREALAHAVETADSQSIAALRVYLADVEDPAKDFVGAELWFCWAAFERLSARWCCARWLRSAADALTDARTELLGASEHYQRAFQLYEQYRLAIHAGVPTDLSVQERARARTTDHPHGPEETLSSGPFACLDDFVAQDCQVQAGDVVKANFGYICEGIVSLRRE